MLRDEVSPCGIDLARNERSLIPTKVSSITCGNSNPGYDNLVFPISHSAKQNEIWKNGFADKVIILI
jgi:hypothetical protein